MSLIERTMARVRAFVDYYTSNRGVGHTRLVGEGVKRFDVRGKRPLVVVHNHQYGETFVKLVERGDVLPIALDGDLMRQLTGRRDPLVFDNFALQLLFQDVLDSLRALEHENRGLKEKLREVRIVVGVD